MTMKQDIHQLSAVQRYPIGFKYPKTNPLDLRAFRYARAGVSDSGALNPSLGAHVGFTQDIPMVAVTLDLAAAGKYTLEILVGAADGRGGNAGIAANELAGGYILIFVTGLTHFINRMIVANTATIAGGGAQVMTVTVLKPLPYALGAGSNAEVIANPYLDVIEGNYDRQAIMGIPTMEAVAGQYLWLQTWGPCWVTPALVDWSTIDSSQAMFRGNGSIAEFIPDDPAVGLQQHAGFVVTPATGGGVGLPFVFLQIAP